MADQRRVDGGATRVSPSKASAPTTKSSSTSCWRGCERATTSTLRQGATLCLGMMIIPIMIVLASAAAHRQLAVTTFLCSASGISRKAATMETLSGNDDHPDGE